MNEEYIPTEAELCDKIWRLSNLYYIINKTGSQIKFNLNWAQQELYNRRWYQMLVLKARQLGVTTFFSINFLDDCFWCDNISAGIIAHRKEDAADIFKKKVKYAYDKMPKWTRTFNSATNDRSGELAFQNGSSYRVSTGFRSGTYQRLLISEFGKICAQSPDVAKEIVTGSLNTVNADQMCVIESTAEGREGYFYDFSKEAERLAIEKKKLSPMQRRFFFFPWFDEPGYREYDEQIIVSQETNEYLNGIEDKCNIKLDNDQRRWYEIKSKDMGDSMKQEYPATPSEAFEASNEGLYYGKQIAKLRADGHITKVPWNDISPVHCSFDVGYDDHTAIWFFQLGSGGVINVLDYYENCNEGAKFYCEYLKSKPYSYGTILLPHDAANKNAAAISWHEIMQSLMTCSFHVIPGTGEESVSIFNGIQAVRGILSRCYFDEVKCQKGLSHLEAYKKEWNDKIGGYRDAPLHNADSHASDSFRYLAVGLDHIGGKRMSKDDLRQLKANAGFGPKQIPLRQQVMNQNPFIGR